MPGALVPDGDWVFRFVAPAHVPNGEIQTANLKSTEWTLPSRPSVFVESRASLQQLEGANTKWRTYAVCRVSVRDLRALGLEVRFSPEDCKIAGIDHAHASLENVTSANREDVIDLFNRCLSRLPAPPQSGP